MSMTTENTQQLSPKEAKRQAKADTAAAKARAKAERPLWKKKRVIIPAVLVLLIVVVIMTSNGADEPEVVTDDPEAQQDAEEAAEAAEAAEEAQDDQLDEVAEGFAIGETVAMGDLEHTFHGARFYDGDEFMSPDEGTRWLLIDAEVTNTGNESEAMSSLIMWDLVDADNRTLDITITGDQQGSLDGELGAGRSMRGEIAYTVADDQSEWELIFAPHVFGFGQAIYEFSVDDAQ